LFHADRWLITWTQSPEPFRLKAHYCGQEVPLAKAGGWKLAQLVRHLPDAL